MRKKPPPQRVWDLKTTDSDGSVLSKASLKRGGDAVQKGVLAREGEYQLFINAVDLVTPSVTSLRSVHVALYVARGSVSSAPGQLLGSKKSLKEGTVSTKWRKQKDPGTGRNYFVNEGTGAVEWEPGAEGVAGEGLPRLSESKSLPVVARSSSADPAELRGSPLTHVFQYSVTYDHPRICHKFVVEKDQLPAYWLLHLASTSQLISIDVQAYLVYYPPSHTGASPVPSPSKPPSRDSSLSASPSSDSESLSSSPASLEAPRVGASGTGSEMASPSSSSTAARSAPSSSGSGSSVPSGPTEEVRWNFEQKVRVSRFSEGDKKLLRSLMYNDPPNMPDVPKHVKEFHDPLNRPELQHSMDILIPLPLDTMALMMWWNETPPSDFQVTTQEKAGDRNLRLEEWKLDDTGSYFIRRVDYEKPKTLFTITAYMIQRMRRMPGGRSVPRGQNSQHELSWIGVGWDMATTTYISGAPYSDAFCVQTYWTFTPGEEDPRGSCRIQAWTHIEWLGSCFFKGAVSKEAFTSAADFFTAFEQTVIDWVGMYQQGQLKVTPLAIQLRVEGAAPPRASTLRGSRKASKARLPSHSDMGIDGDVFGVKGVPFWSSDEIVFSHAARSFAKVCKTPHAGILIVTISRMSNINPKFALFAPLDVIVRLHSGELVLTTLSYSIESAGSGECSRCSQLLVVPQLEDGCSVSVEVSVLEEDDAPTQAEEKVFVQLSALKRVEGAVAPVVAAPVVSGKPMAAPSPVVSRVSSRGSMTSSTGGVKTGIVSGAASTAQPSALPVPVLLLLLFVMAIVLFFDGFDVIVWLLGCSVPVANVSLRTVMRTIALVGLVYTARNLGGIQQSLGGLMG